VSIRRASLPSDTRSIYSLLKHIDLSIYPEPTNIENPDDQWFIYEEKGRIIGCVAARKSRGEIRHIVVLPKHEGKGIGTQLGNCAIGFLKDIGYLGVWVQVRVQNKRSQGLFEKLGFKREPRTIRSRKNPQVKLYKYVLTLCMHAKRGECSEITPFIMVRDQYFYSHLASPNFFGDKEI